MVGRSTVGSLISNLKTLVQFKDWLSSETLLDFGDFGQFQRNWLSLENLVEFRFFG